MGLLSTIGNAISSVKNSVITAVANKTTNEQNALSTVKAALTGSGVQANTSSVTANKILSAAASNPYTTALGAAVISNPTAAGAVAKQVATTAVSTTKGKIITAIAVPSVVSAVIANPKLVSQASQLPSNIASFSGNIAGLASNPTLSNAEQIVKDNPILSAAAAIAGVTFIGKGITGLIASAENTAASRANTAATKAAMAAGAMDNTATLPKETTATTSMLATNSADIPITPATQVLGKSSSSKVSTYRKTNNKNKSNLVSNRLQVNIFNQSKTLYTRAFRS